MPLFPGYIFVRTRIDERLAVLETPGVIYLVGAREPEPLEDEEIEQLKAGTKSGEARPSVYPVAGDAVRVIRGPLTGREGTLVRERGKNRVVVMVASVGKAMSVEVEMDAVTLARQGCVGGAGRGSFIGRWGRGDLPPRVPASSVGTPNRSLS